MVLTDPHLLYLIGAGFRGDPYATDGHHLRWSFDTRLGFPRTAFCLERRRSLRGKQGLEEAGHPRVQSFGSAEGTGTVGQIDGAALTVFSPGRALTVSPDGVLVDRIGLVLDVHGGAARDPSPACWVRLTLRLPAGGSVDARAQVAESGATVDDATAGGPDPFADDVLQRVPSLARPERSLGPAAYPPALAPLHDALAAADPSLAEVRPAWLERVAAELQRAGLEIADLAAAAPAQTVQVVLVAPRIDLVAVSGAGWLNQMEWLTLAQVDKAKGWERVGCYPILTDDGRYRSDNAVLLGGQPARDLAKALLLGGTRPRGAEPLDDAEVPPSRDAADGELEARYLMPWDDRLEPWVQAVLSGSSGGVQHQSEIEQSSPLSDLGQEPGAGLPPDLPGSQEITVRPYVLLLAASLAFQVARQLGLAAVVDSPDDQPWDYRVRGRWLPEDLLAFTGALQRRLAADQTAPPDETPAQATDRLLRTLQDAARLAVQAPLINQLIASGGGGPVEVLGYCFGVTLAPAPLPAAPTGLTVTDLGRAAPISGLAPAGEADVGWDLKAQAQTADDAAIPIAVTVARGPTGVDPFPDVLNPQNPDTGARQGIVPPQDPLNPGGAGRTSFRDRRVPPDMDLRYGVSQCDPFGRWSPFSEIAYRFDDHQPPAPPRLDAVTLQTPGGEPTLTVAFSWPPPGEPLAADDATFHLRLLRTPPATGPATSAGVDPRRDPAAWPVCERTPASGAPPYAVPGSGAGGTAAHDGMSVTVTRTPSGSRFDYQVAFAGIDLAPDALGRTDVYVAATTQDTVGADSIEVGGPLRATLVSTLPPPAPVLPPDPLLATYPDAQDRSSITMSWDGTTDTRYTLFRASERDVVGAATRLHLDLSAYTAATTPAFRAAALKTLAVHTRDAFHPAAPPTPPWPTTGSPPVDLPPANPATAVPAGPVAVTDELPGSLDLLTVYAALGTHRNGSVAAWPATPDGFAVVAVPKIAAPSPPTVLRGVWQDPDPSSGAPERTVGHVELTVAEPPPGAAPIARLEVYRTADVTDTDDYRRMTPLFALDVNDASWETIVLAGASVRVVRYVDATAQDWQVYAYRVVARAPGVGGAPAGTRSAASRPTIVRTESAGAPPAPTGLVATTSPDASGADQLVVTFAAEPPTPAFGRSVLQLLDAGSGALLVQASAADAVAAGGYRLSALIPASGQPGRPAQVAARLIDPRGRATTSAAVPVPA